MSIRRFDGRSAMVRGVVWLCCLPLVLGNGALVAQTPAAQAPATTTQPAPQGGSGAAETATKLNNDQLDSLVAPVALYPDPLLSQALVASTYPLELVQAQQWLAKNTTLKGDALSSAVEKQDWDPSVQATVVVPDLLKRLTEDISWTHSLGNAFLEQPDDVMNAVQRLRSKAKAAGKLETTEQQKVATTVVETKTVIEIQPTSTQVVYVPTYSPTVIWGAPMYYPYPPIYYPPYPPGAAWIGFGVGVAVGIGISGGWGYGCRWGGGGNNIYINNNNNFVRNNNIRTGNINTGNINRGNSNWQHNPSHRGGAPYSNTATANRYGGSTRAGSTSARQTSSRAAGASATGASRASGGAGATGSSGAAGGAGATRASGGGDRAGSRSIPQTSSRSGSSAFGGASGGASGASRATGASSRGASSMGSRGGGGGGRRR